MVAAEDIKLSEVDAWADASRQKTEQLDDSLSETAMVRGKTVIQLWEGGSPWGRDWPALPLWVSLLAPSAGW